MMFRPRISPTAVDHVRDSTCLLLLVKVGIATLYKKILNAHKIWLMFERGILAKRFWLCLWKVTTKAMKG